MLLNGRGPLESRLHDNHIMRVLTGADAVLKYPT